MNTTLAERTVAKKKAEPRDRLDLRIDPEMVARVQRQADRFGASLSAYIRGAIARQLERDEADEIKSGRKS